MNLTEQEEAELNESAEVLAVHLQELNEQVEDLQLSKPARWRIEQNIDRTEERLKRARQRESSGGCPGGLWCKGAGGVGFVAMQDDLVTHYRCEKFCACQAGAERRLADFNVSEEIRLGKNRETCFKWLEDGGLPDHFRAFAHHELSTISVPDTDDARALMAQLQDWVTGEPELPPWLYIHSGVGRGKTSLEVAITKALIRSRGCGVQLVDVTELLARIRRTYSRGAGEVEGDIMHKLTTATVLILDDFGAQRDTDWTTEHLFSLINTRYGRCTKDSGEVTIISSNYTLSELAARIGGVDGERIAWRIGERSLTLSLEDWPNLRMPRSAAAIEPAKQATAANVRPFKKTASRAVSG